MGYITKRSASEQLVTAIRKVRSGRRFLPEDIAEALALRLVKGAKRGSPLDSLSTRELQVLKRLAQGQTNQEIAAAYYLSVKTVDTYRLRILKKLNLRNNAELSRFAMQHRIIE
jgi:DNA-binding NarL/FixJ family response regulator